MFRTFPWCLLLSPDGDGGGNSNNDDGDSRPPKSDDQDGDSSLVTKKFDEGYGRGIRKGRKEGRTEGVGYALAELGFDGMDLDAVKANLKELKSGKKKSDTKPVDIDVTSTEEYKAIAKELRLASETIQSLEKQSSKLAAYEAKTLDAAIKNELIKHGVATDSRLDAFVRLHQSRFKLDDNGELEVLDRMSDGSMVNTGVSPEKFVKELLKSKENQWAIASSNTSGAGSGNDRSQPKKQYGPNDPRPYDKTAAIAAYMGLKGTKDVD